MRMSSSTRAFFKNQQTPPFEYFFLQIFARAARPINASIVGMINQGFETKEAPTKIYAVSPGMTPIAVPKK